MRSLSALPSAKISELSSCATTLPGCTGRPTSAAHHRLWQRILPLAAVDRDFGDRADQREADRRQPELAERNPERRAVALAAPVGHLARRVSTTRLAARVLQQREPVCERILARRAAPARRSRTSIAKLVAPAPMPRHGAVRTPRSS